MKLRKVKTWTEKVTDVTKVHQVKKLDKDFADMPANSTMLIATPKIIDEYVKQIPKGEKVSLQTIRKDLAVEHKVDFTCPVTSGIFLRMVSEAAYEQVEQGKPVSSVTPFWRVVDGKSALIKKLSFGAEFVLQQRQLEGLDENTITKK